MAPNMSFPSNTSEQAISNQTSGVGFPFMQFPREIRNLVYTEYYYNYSTISYKVKSCLRPPPMAEVGPSTQHDKVKRTRTTLSLATKQIRHEYAENERVLCQAIASQVFSFSFLSPAALHGGLLNKVAPLPNIRTCKLIIDVDVDTDFKVDDVVAFLALLPAARVVDITLTNTSKTKWESIFTGISIKIEKARRLRRSAGRWACKEFIHLQIIAVRWCGMLMRYMKKAWFVAGKDPEEWELQRPELMGKMATDEEWLLAEKNMLRSSVEADLIDALATRM